MSMLRVSEIFHSIQGEGSRAGLPCVFVRLHGCGLRCVWCDTPYALDHRSGGEEMDVEHILHRVAAWNCDFVEVTGGDRGGVNDLVFLESEEGDDAWMDESRQPPSE